MSNTTPTPAQIRAALAILNWDYRTLSKKLKPMSIDTISRICRGDSGGRESNLKRIGLAFERENIEFLENDGVRRTPKTHEDFNGPERLKDFMAYMQEQIDKYGGEVCVVAVNEKLFRAYRGEGFDAYKAKMRSHVETGWVPSFRVIAAESEFRSTWAKYRVMPKHGTMPTAFYYFCGQLAMIVFDRETPFVHLIRSQVLADAWKSNNFETQWENASEP